MTKCKPATTQTEYTLKIRQWGSKPLPEDWHYEEFQRISHMIAEGFTAGEIVSDEADGEWWDLSCEETQS